MLRSDVVMVRGAQPFAAGRRARGARRCCCARTVTAAFSVQPPPSGGERYYTLSVRVPTPERLPLVLADSLRLDSAAALAAAVGLIALGQLWRTWTVGWRDTSPPADARRLAATQALAAQRDTAPLGVFWDVDNCAVPAAVLPHSLSGSVLASLRACGYRGPLRTFMAFGDVALMRTATRRQLSATGVLLCDVPSGRKDAADRALLQEMLLFARDVPPPAHVLLITGDRDFAPAAHKLRQLGYNVMLSAPIATAAVAPELLGAAARVFDWASLACGLVQYAERERARGESAAARVGNGDGSLGGDDDSSAAAAAAVAAATAALARRGSRARATQVGAFVAAAAAAIEREDASELARVVDKAQAAGLKATREVALLSDLRRKLEARRRAALEVRTRLERAVQDGDVALADSALLAARTAGVARAPELQSLVQAAARLVREGRRTRRGVAGAVGGPAGDDGDDGEEDGDDDDDDEEEEEGEEEEEDDAEAAARAAAAMAAHRRGSKRRQQLARAGAPDDAEAHGSGGDEVEAAPPPTQQRQQQQQQQSHTKRDDSWAGRPWGGDAPARPLPPPQAPTRGGGAPAASSSAAPPSPFSSTAVDGAASLLACIDADAAAPAWYAAAVRCGAGGCDLALLTSAVERGSAAGVDTSAAAALLALCARARSAAGSLLRAVLTRKTHNLGALLASMRSAGGGAAIGALIPAELAEARAAHAALLASADGPAADWDPEAHGARVCAALAAEDAAALRAALLDGALRGGVAADEPSRARLKTLVLAGEAAAELRRATSAGDVGVLRSRVARVRKDYVTRHAARTFPALGGALLADLTRALEEAEDALARLAAPEDTHAPAAPVQANGNGSAQAPANAFALACA
jgi:hypothetical protein